MLSSASSFAKPILIVCLCSIQGSKGTYNVKAKYFSSSEQKLSGGTTILLTLITNFSRANEEKKMVMVRLATSKDEIDVGQIGI